MMFQNHYEAQAALEVAEGDEQLYLAAELASHPSEFVRRKVISVAVEHGDPGRLLPALLRDPAGIVVVDAAEALVRLGQPEPVLQLARGAATWVQSQLLRALAPSSLEGIDELYLEVLSQEDPPDEVFIALVAHPVPHAAERLARFSDESAWAAAALGLLGDPRARVGIETAIEDYPASPYLMKQLLIALGRIGHSDSLPMLWQALDDESGGPQLNAAEALVSCSATTGDLLAYFERDYLVEPVMQVFILGLGERDGPEVTKALVDLASWLSGASWGTCMEVIASRREPDVLPLLAGCFVPRNDVDMCGHGYSARSAAAERLSTLTTGQLAGLYPATDAKSVQQLSSAIEHVEGLRSEPFPSRLIETSRSEHALVRRATIWGLAALATAAATARLQALASDPDSDVRETAELALE
jgi:HEAT repeat protein